MSGYRFDFVSFRVISWIVSLLFTPSALIRSLPLSALTRPKFARKHRIERSVSLAYDRLIKFEGVN